MGKGPRVKMVGEPDVILAISDLGGIRPRRPGKPTNGLYDGWKDAIQGDARQIVRNDGLAPDDMRQALSAVGFRFDTVSEMYDAIASAAENRPKIRESIREQAEEKAKFVMRDGDPEDLGPDEELLSFSRAFIRRRSESNKYKLYVEVDGQVLHSGWLLLRPPGQP